LQVKLCDPCLSALCVPWCEKALYKYSSFPFLSLTLQISLRSDKMCARYRLSKMFAPGKKVDQSSAKSLKPCHAQMNRIVSNFIAPGQTMYNKLEKRYNHFIPFSNLTPQRIPRPGRKFTNLCNDLQQAQTTHVLNFVPF